MKKVLSMVLMAGLLAAPMYAVELDKVTAQAKSDSGVSLDALCMAVYDAVKDDPGSAAAVFEGVMQQRSSWSVTETYAILRSVLMADSALQADFESGVAAYNNGSQTPDSASQGYQLAASLYTMAQTQAVAQSVVQGIVGSASSGSGVPGVSRASSPAVPAAPSRPEYTVTPTPPPTSTNN